MDYAVHHINNIKPGLCLYLVIEVQIEFLIMKLAICGQVIVMMIS